MLLSLKKVTYTFYVILSCFAVFCGGFFSGWLVGLSAGFLYNFLLLKLKNI